jgi:hypothetical protein
MRAYRVSGRDVVPGGPTEPWQGAGDGLDAWARASAGRALAARSDTGSVDGLVWGCHGGDPAAQLQRRWEYGGRRDADGRYVTLGGMFPAWEGGRGGYDCEPLARPFPPGRPRYSVELSYSLGRTIDP